MTAPGGDYGGFLIGTLLNGGTGYWYDANGGTAVGTSYAAPHVAGLAALVLELFPTMTPYDLKYRIEDTADDMNSSTYPGWDEELGWGRINANAATTIGTATHSFPSTINGVCNTMLISIPAWPNNLDKVDSLQARANDIARLFPNNPDAQILWWHSDIPSPNQGEYRDYRTDLRVPRFGPGRGYWVRLNNAVNVTYSAAIPFQKSNHLLPIRLKAGWNFIGVPGDKPIRWDLDRIQFRMGKSATDDPNHAGMARTISMRQAVSEQLFSPMINSHYIVKHDPATNQYLPVQEGEYLEPGKGYAINYQGSEGFCDCSSVELLIPESSLVTRGPGSGQSPNVTMSWHTWNLGHNVGIPEDDGWRAFYAIDNPGMLQYGPYTREAPVGYNNIKWELMIGNPSPGETENSPIFYLDVIDVDDNYATLAARQVFRRDFSWIWTWNDFSLPFYLDQWRKGHQLEFRVYWYGHSYVRHRSVRLIQE